MVKHIVMWKLKDFAEGKSKLENANIIKKGLEDLKGKVNVLQFIEVGINTNESGQDFDLVLCTEFNSKKDLDTYQNHPEHLKVSGYIGKVNNERAAVDYEI